jgi:exodeoxyribonuclease VII small subunit
MAFTEDMNELERTVQRLEKEELPLEEALDLYEDGLGLVRRCSPPSFGCGAAH